MFTAIALAMLFSVSEPNYDAVKETTAFLSIQNENTAEYISEKKEPSVAGCSGTKISLHTFLTNAHCAVSDKVTYSIDGKKGILKGPPILDSNDHMLLTFSNITFDHTAKFAQKLPKVGKSIFFFGNPTGLIHQVLRVGHVAVYPVVGVMMVDVNGWHGDSGAGVFNEDGQIVTTIMSGWPGKHEEVRNDEDGPAGFKLMVGMVFNFTPEVTAKLKAGLDAQ